MRMIGLKRLQLTLMSAENLNEWNLDETDFSEACFTYGNVFHLDGRWPRLSELYLNGLAITGFDLYYLLSFQTPKLEGLWLYHIDLLEGKWEGIVECLKGTHDWQILSFQGTFQHCDV